MRNPDTPRHAHVRYGQSGRLHPALLPAALAGVVVGSVWLAAYAAAEPVADHSGSASDGSSYSASPSPSTTDGGWSSSYAGWPDGDGQNSYDQSQSYDGQYPSYADRHSYDGQYSRDARQHAYYDYSRQRDWRDHPGDHSSSSHPRVTVTRSASAPHPANSAPARADSPATNPNDRAAPAAMENTAPAGVAAAQQTAQKGRAVHATRPSATAPASATRLPSASRSDLAAVDTARPATDYVALYGAIGGAALAALLGMGGVALWRRRGAAGTQG